MLDVPGLHELLRGLHRRELSLVEVETQTASPFASSLLFDYVATYMYEGDTPNAERRAAALSLDRDLLRELLGPGGAARPDRPGRARRRSRHDLQHLLASARGPTTRDDAARRAAPRRRPDARTRPRGACAPVSTPRRCSPSSSASAARVRLRVGGEERWIAADDAGLYRDALGAVPPGGLPEAFLADVADALRKLIARYARTHGPFTTAELARALRRRSRRRRCASSSATATSCAASCAPAGRSASGATPRCCAACAAPRWPSLRKEIEPADQRALAAFLPSWQGVDRHPRAGAGIDRLREILVPLQGLALPADVWERDVLPRRVGAYSPTWMDQLCASGELVWVGAGALGRNSGRVALYFREDAAAIGPPPQSKPSRRPSRAHERSASGSPPRRASSPTCSPSSSRRPRSSRRRCGTSSGRAR